MIRFFFAFLYDTLQSERKINMENFIYDIPTKVYFGKGQIVHLPEMLKEFGTRVLFVYGGGSIRRIGLYDEIVKLLKENGIEWTELSGVQANPRVESVREGVRLVREHDIECVLAVGGGSTLDCCKAICAASRLDMDAWQMVKNPKVIRESVPLVTVLTMSATGSEMDKTGVITNMETKEKVGFNNYHCYPKYSILDPVYTFSVPAYQTAAGTADIMSHVMESYFGEVTDAWIPDGISETILRTCIHYAPIALENPEDYTARANLMWSASLAINGLTFLGKTKAWSCHPLEHVLSAYYDITHGVGLAILTPRWMEYILNDNTVDQLARFAYNVWDVDRSVDKWDAAKQGIRKLYDFFKSMNIPMTLTEAGIDDSQLEEMADRAAEKDYSKMFYPLNREDILNIYKACL